MSLRKLFLALGLLLLVGVWGACVDIPSGPGTDVTLNFRSLVRFVHMVPGGGAGDIKVDGATVANLSFPNASGYVDVAAGSRQVAFGSAAAQTISFGSEQQGTLVVYGDGSLLLNLIEGHKDKNNGKAGKAKVKFINVANGAAATVAFRKDSARLNATAPNTLASRPYANAAQYTELDAGAYSLFAVSSGGYKADTIRGTGSATTGFGVADLSVDAGLSVTATIKSRNSEGFFTAARLDTGSATGQSLYAIPVRTQTMTFRSIALSGANEVPPVTTTATGTATLTVVNDSTATTGASYSVTTTTPNLMGFFTAAHIHNGAAGTIGGVVHTISVAKQIISFPTITATGSNTTANATCTFTLFRDSLVYSIRVRRDLFDTTFTAAHFHSATTGLVVKDIRTTSWSDTARTLAGTWRRTDTTQALTDALVDSIRLGRLYVNFHSTGRPLGLIRADMIPNATHNNTFTGRFTQTAFFNLRDEFAFSRMYFNFHTTANPTGEIRGQALPDTFSTNEYTFSLSSVPANISGLLNEGKVFFNFSSNASPNVVRGRISVDAAKGEYAVASQNHTFDAGRMYTVIATGKGSSFQVIRLDDRQVGVTAPSPAPPPVQEKRVEVKKQQAKTND